MDTRNLYDLTHFSYITSDIGRLQTVSIIPVLPGDSFEFDVQGIYRLADLRRELVQDAQVDIFYFYRPHRHEYGDDWIDIMKQGTDEAVTLPTTTLVGTRQYDIYCLPDNNITQIPAWVDGGYRAIYNRYFKHPDDSDITGIPGSDTTALLGYLIGRLPSPKWNPRRSGPAGAAERDLEQSDWEYFDGTAVSGSALTLNLRELDAQKGKFKSEVASNILANRYEEVMKNRFNVSLDENIDQRPTLLWRHSFMTSGTEINATDTTSLGSFVGKSFGSASHNIPRRYFDEHGAIFVMATVRFPSIHEFGRHHLLDRPQVSYNDMPDPEIMQASEPRSFTSAYFTTDGTTATNDFDYPEFDCYRYHTNRVSERYRAIAGYPLSSTTLSSINNTWYHTDGEYDDVFATLEMNQWQMNLRLGINALRFVPDPLTSWFQGSD